MDGGFFLVNGNLDILKKMKMDSQQYLDSQKS